MPELRTITTRAATHKHTPTSLVLTFRLLPRVALIALTLIVHSAPGHQCFAGATQPTFGRPKDTRPNQPVPEDDAATGNAPKPMSVPPIELWNKEDAPRLAPTSPAEPGKIYTWQFDEGTRFAWSLPFGYERGKSYNAVILLHPARLDFRWGFASHARKPSPQGFRPDEIVISVDGLSGDLRAPNQRYFDPDDRNLVRMRDILLEVTRKFPIRRVYLYGSGDAPTDDGTPGAGGKSTGGGGGGFAAAFSGRFPALADGVLAHASGILPGSAAKSTVPIVFMHGDKDSLTPLQRATLALADYQERHHEQVYLRVLRNYNDFPNPVRASECLSLLMGLTDDDPDRVLNCAIDLLTPKPADEFSYSAPVWFGGAYQLLGRIAGADAKPKNKSTGYSLTEPSAKTKQRAIELRTRLDEYAAKCAQSIAELINSDDLRTLPIDGGPWLGALPAFREDFRGIPAADALAASLGYDQLAKEHQAAADELCSAWHARTNEEAATLSRVLELLPGAYLSPSLPVGLPGWTKVVLRKADELSLPDELRTQAEFVSLFEQGQRTGLAAYARLWRVWSVPAAPDEAPTSEK